VDVTVLTVICHAGGGIATASRLSVRQSVTFRYRDHIVWNSSKIISLLRSLGSSLSADPTSRIYSPRV